MRVYHHEIWFTEVFLGGKYIEKVFLSYQCLSWCMILYNTVYLQYGAAYLYMKMHHYEIWYTEVISGENYIEKVFLSLKYHCWSLILYDTV